MISNIKAFSHNLANCLHQGKYLFSFSDHSKFKLLKNFVLLLVCFRGPSNSSVQNWLLLAQCSGVALIEHREYIILGKNPDHAPCKAWALWTNLLCCAVFLPLSSTELLILFEDFVTWKCFLPFPGLPFIWQGYTTAVQKSFWVWCSHTCLNNAFTPFICRWRMVMRCLCSATEPHHWPTWYFWKVKSAKSGLCPKPCCPSQNSYDVYCPHSRSLLCSPFPPHHSGFLLLSGFYDVSSTGHACYPMRAWTFAGAAFRMWHILGLYITDSYSRWTILGVCVCMQPVTRIYNLVCGHLWGKWGKQGEMAPLLLH